MDSDDGDVALSEARVAEWMRTHKGIVAKNEVSRESPSSRPQSKAVAGEASGDEEAGWATVDRSNNWSLVRRRIYVPSPGQLDSDSGEIREQPVESLKSLTYRLRVRRWVDLSSALPELTPLRHSRHARRQVTQKGSANAHP